MKRLIFGIAILMWAGLALAQVEEPAASIIEWSKVLALTINVPIVFLVTGLIAWAFPKIPGGFKQIVALVSSSLILWAQTAVGEAIGYPVDLSGIAEAIQMAAGGGLAAMGTYDVLSRVARNTGILG